MGFLSDLKTIEYKHWVFAVIAFFGTVASGFLIIFQFRPEIIEKYDLVKIIFLSLGLTLPIAMTNSMYYYYRDGFTRDRYVHFGAAFALNVVVIYIPLLISYFFSLHFRWFLALVALLEFMFFAAARWFKQKTTAPQETQR